LLNTWRKAGVLGVTPWVCLGMLSVVSCTELEPVRPTEPELDTPDTSLPRKSGRAKLSPEPPYLLPKTLNKSG